jgi:hypothetical protein
LSRGLRPGASSRSCASSLFAEYVAEAEKHGAKGYPLYAWTKATIENPAKKEKYTKSFTLNADGKEVYAKEIADALEARPLSLISPRNCSRRSSPPRQRPLPFRSSACNFSTGKTRHGGRNGAHGSNIPSAEDGLG